MEKNYDLLKKSMVPVYVADFSSRATFLENKNVELYASPFVNSPDSSGALFSTCLCLCLCCLLELAIQYTVQVCIHKVDTHKESYSKVWSNYKVFQRVRSAQVSYQPCQQGNIGTNNSYLLRGARGHQIDGQGPCNWTHALLHAASG